MGNKHYNHFTLIVGNTYGQLTILSDPKIKNPGRKKLWFCACNCGKQLLVPSDRIQKRINPSCGCSPATRTKVVLGEKFGLLTVISDTGHRYHRSPILKCLCDCGNTIERPFLKLKGSKFPSCGCNRYPHKKEIFEINLYKKYSASAKSRKMEFDLTYEQFLVYINSNCAYCGTAPIPYKWKMNGYTVEGFKNGIDRVNSSMGYTNNNCVSCCFRCNFAKGDRSIDEFKSWLKKAHDHLFH